MYIEFKQPMLYKTLKFNPTKRGQLAMAKDPSLTRIYLKNG